MGLDIGAMRGLKPAPENWKIDEDWVIDETGECPGIDYYVVRTHPTFSEQADELKDRTIYVFDEYVSHYLGSYGAYNSWRKTLCRLAIGVDDIELWKNSEQYADMPFFELINFSDCSGVIGTKTCAKLFNDFANFKNEAISTIEEVFHRHGEDKKHWLHKYDELMSAFKIGSDNGCVDFH